MINAILAIAALFPSLASADSSSSIKQKLIDFQTPLAIEALEEDFPDVDWSMAPVPTCASEADQSEYDALFEEDSMFIYGTFNFTDFKVSINCSRYLPDLVLQSTIYHEYIHWMQHVITFGEEITAPVDEFHGYGIGVKTYERLGCIGAIEAEAWTAELDQYPGIYADEDDEEIREVLALMAGCVGDYADFGTPFMSL